jgi:hypothetical protein
MRRCRLAACFVFAYVFTGYSSPVGIGKAWPYGSVSVSRLARLYALRGHRFGFVYVAMNHLKVKRLSRAWELLNAFHRIFSIRHRAVSRLSNALRGDVTASREACRTLSTPRDMSAFLAYLCRI